jgi:hypothetical protein
MSEKMKTLQLKQFNTDYPITLVYDQCKSGESQYGPWNLYGVVYSGEQQGIFADEHLHNKLKQYGKGTKLIIRRNQDENGQLKWIVVPANGNGDYKPTKTYSSFLDYRTRDIHRQVALKIATISIGASLKPWNESDLDEIRNRMDRLLVILDGEVSNE